MGFGGSAWSRAKEMACTLRTSLEYYTGFLTSEHGQRSQQGQ